MNDTPDIYTKPAQPGAALERLRGIVARLRDPVSGCPWDRIQTLETLKPCLVEESYELLDKMATDDLDGHREELGDVMLQLVFQSGIREDAGAFTLADAINATCDKLIRRHPHVFGDMKLDDASEVLANWERIKRAEGGGKDGAEKSPFAGVPKALPALLKAQRVQSKAAKAGFEPIPKDSARKALDSALAALDAKSQRGGADVKRALGDVLFTAAALARSLDVDAESALGFATDAFISQYDALHHTSAAGADGDANNGKGDNQ